MRADAWEVFRQEVQIGVSVLKLFFGNALRGRRVEHCMQVLDLGREEEGEGGSVDGKGDFWEGGAGGVLFSGDEEGVLFSGDAGGLLFSSFLLAFSFSFKSMLAFLIAVTSFLRSTFRDLTTNSSFRRSKLLAINCDERSESQKRVVMRSGRGLLVSGWRYAASLQPSFAPRSSSPRASAPPDA